MKKTITYINNRKASYNYYIDESYHAGIVLSGSEVKSIRSGHANISEAYCYFSGNELFLKNAFIKSQNNLMFGHKELQDRKLLLSKHELRELHKAYDTKGLSIIPLSIEVPARGYIKLNIAICRGKHNYDKRDAIKQRDIERDLMFFKK
ncbi:MAG: hypothetical protein [Wendovervirus sonii]|uniref:SsrA-binding protein n=1 Tax=phage Lak_Megaphage_Sonny TaxID=3109229 RepID=A0ABZ0Z658_9CAUD|nr:MAG: hypothetical protein [phage Lak_Megaphage_Sonny]